MVLNTTWNAINMTISKKMKSMISSKIPLNLLLESSDIDYVILATPEPSDDV